MFKRLMHRWVLMNEAGGDDGGTSAAGAAGATGAVSAGDGQSGSGGQDGGAGTGEVGSAAAAGDGLTPPESLLGKDGTEANAAEKPADKVADQTTPDEPITYEAFKTPDGVTLDEAKLGEFTKIAAEAKMPQEVAQKMIDLYTAEAKQVAEAPMRAWTELQSKWQDEVRSDPVIGGQNLDKNLAATKAGINALLGEDAKSFFEALNITGAGNNPAILRGLMKAAAPHAPATPVGGNPGSGTKSPGQTLYPKMAGLGNGHEG